MQSAKLTPDEVSWVARQLGRSPFLDGLSSEDIQALVGHCTVLRLPANADVFVQGEQPERDAPMFLVLSGRVLLSRAVANQSERRITMHGPLDTFGELSTFDPGPRTTSARCLSDVVLLTITRTAALEWASECPGGFEALLRLMARRLRRTQDLWTDLVFVDLPARLARALLELAYTVGESVDGSWRLVDVATQEELARRIGGSREAVNRALGSFERRGWIQGRSRTVLLLDTNALWLRAGAPATLTPPRVAVPVQSVTALSVQATSA